MKFRVDFESEASKLNISPAARKNISTCYVNTPYNYILGMYQCFLYKTIQYSLVHGLELERSNHVLKKCQSIIFFIC